MGNKEERKMYCPVCGNRMFFMGREDGFTYDITYNLECKTCEIDTGWVETRIEALHQWYEQIYNKKMKMEMVSLSKYAENLRDENRIMLESIIHRGKIYDQLSQEKDIEIQKLNTRIDKANKVNKAMAEFAIESTKQQEIRGKEFVQLVLKIAKEK